MNRRGFFSGVAGLTSGLAALSAAEQISSRPRKAEVVRAGRSLGDEVWQPARRRTDEHRKHHHPEPEAVQHRFGLSPAMEPRQRKARGAKPSAQRLADPRLIPLRSQPRIELETP
jgi:hypothetical protein